MHSQQLHSLARQPILNGASVFSTPTRVCEGARLREHMCVMQKPRPLPGFLALLCELSVSWRLLRTRPLMIYLVLFSFSGVGD